MKNTRRLLITHNVNCQFGILARTINMINLVHISIYRSLILHVEKKKAYTVFKKVSTLEEKVVFFSFGVPTVLTMFFFLSTQGPLCYHAVKDLSV